MNEAPEHKLIQIAPTDGGWWTVNLAEGEWHQVVMWAIVEMDEGARWVATLDPRTEFHPDYFFELSAGEWRYSYLGLDPSKLERDEALDAWREQERRYLL